MNKFLITIEKEAKILFRDREGLALLFLMPLILVFVITLLQEKTYQSINETRIPVILVNNDQDSVGDAFCKGITENGFFDVTLVEGADSLIIEEARKRVAKGQAQIGILIPEGTTKAIRNRVVGLVQEQVPDMMQGRDVPDATSVSVELFFDPITKDSFRNIIKSNLNEFASKVETRIVFFTYSKIIDAITGMGSEVSYPEDPVIRFNEKFISEYKEGTAPNSVQHNVPAWTLFAMFFICIPLAGNLIKDRDEGCLDRLKTMPVSYMTIMISKVIVYLVVTFLQALVILLVGMFIMPFVGLPALELGDSIAGLVLITIASGLAACCYGILIGTISRTYSQASTFGSVSVVIFAALGGIWIPLYVMSATMRKISMISPMNWGLQGYYEHFLRNSDLVNVFPYASYLILFCVVCLLIAFVYKKKQKR